MFFASQPKDRKEDLFARATEYQKLKMFIENGDPLVILIGTRRVGKTSLLQSTLSEFKNHAIYIDPRLLATSKSISREDVIEIIENSLRQFIESNHKAGVLNKLQPFLSVIKGVSAGGVGIDLDFSSRNPADIQALFSQLDKWAAENGRLVVAIDEAQKFASVQSGTDVTDLLAYIYDRCKNITVILTGSEIGLLYDFLGFNKGGAPLYGRDRRVVKLEPLKPEESKEFLVNGFHQKKMSEEATKKMDIIDRAVLNLDGIIGWLIIFANKCAEMGSITEESIALVQKDGSVLAREQFEKFLKHKSKRSLLRKIVQQCATLNQFEFVKSNIDVKDRERLVKELINEGYLAIVEGKYTVIDPLLAFSFQPLD